MVSEKLKLILSAVDNTSPVISEIQRRLNKLSNEIMDHSKKLANAQESREVGKQLAAIRRRVKEYNALKRELNSLTRAYKDMEAKMPLGKFRKMETSLRSLSKTFRRAAVDMVWGTLSILGVVWSLEGFLNRTTQPLLNFANNISDVSGSARDLARWLAFAKKEGMDFADNIDISETVKDAVDVSSVMQATFGNLQSAITYFFTQVFSGEEGKQLLEEVKSTFNELIAFLTDEDTISAARTFIKSMVEGIREAIPILETLLEKFKPIIPVVGKFAGKLAVLMPIIAPLLVGLQSFGAISQIITFGVSLLTKTIGGLGGGLARLVTRIVTTIARFGGLRSAVSAVFTLIRAHPLGILVTVLGLVVLWLYDVTDGFKDWNKALEAIKRPINWLIDKLSFLSGAFDKLKSGSGWLFEKLGFSAPSNPVSSPKPSVVNINQYMNIEKVEQSADAKEFASMLAEDIAFNLG